jgi:iron complex outermembrane receptor protein
MALGCALPRWSYAQQADTTPRFTLPPITVSVTRAALPLTKIPLAIAVIAKAQISQGKPTWGLDEALASVPGVYAENRFNFSLDQRISIRGFGARSAFAVRGIKVLLDGIPQTLPDGQGQLTNLELGAVDRIEVLRGSSSALFGNAAGGVISIWTDPTPPTRLSQEVRVTGGTFDRHFDRVWSKWQSTTQFRLGAGGGSVTLSRLAYDGERVHSAADIRNLNTRVQLPLGTRGWTLAVLADLGDDPRADNPGALTAPELHTNRDTAPAINLNRHAGKDVSQAQGGVTLRRQFAAGGEAALTVFALTRDLRNPQTFAFIDVNRVAYGARLSMTQPVPLGGLRHRLTAGVDFQRQRDDRRNYSYRATDSSRVDTSARQLDQLEHVTEIGPFVQSAVELGAHTTVTGGLRYDRVRFQVGDRLITGPANPDDSGERLMRALSGALGVAVNPSPAVTLYANVGSSFETPTTTELANRPSGAGGFNDSLGPQRAVNYEIGARGQVDGRFDWSLALFQANVRDELIAFEVPGAPQRRFFRNAGKARHRGLEAGVTVALRPDLTLVGNYSYSDFRYTRYAFTTGSGPTARTFVLDGNALPGIPAHWAHVVLRARPGFARGAWAELETSHASSTLVDDTLAVRATAWWTASVRVGWDGAVAGLRLGPFLGINNAFNRMYVGSVVINAAQGRYYEPAAGRNLYLGFTLGAAP